MLFIPSLALALAVWSGSSKLKVNAGAATLRLVVPADIAASVEVHRGPSGLKTEGEWAVNGRTYTTDNSDPSWSILLEMGVGSLTLMAE